LVLAVVQHGTVGTIGNGEDVRSDLITSLTTVGVDHEVRVDGDLLVRVDYNTEKSGVGLKKKGIVRHSVVLIKSRFEKTALT